MKNESWTPKLYPEEQKKNIDNIIEQYKGYRDALDELDKTVFNHKDDVPASILLGWGRTAAGLGNQMRKLHLKFEAAVRNAEANRYMEIKMECDCAEDKKYTDGGAKMDAQNYVSYIRSARNLFQGYVESADTIISVCRMHLATMAEEKRNEVAA